MSPCLGPPGAGDVRESVPQRDLPEGLPVVHPNAVILAEPQCEVHDALLSVRGGHRHAERFPERHAVEGHHFRHVCCLEGKGIEQQEVT